MGVYIKGIEMPEHGMVINIYPDGRVADHFDEFQETIATAVPVPPHGDLIDRDALKRHIATEWFCGKKRVNVPWKAVADASTIIPTEDEWPEWRTQILGELQKEDK